MGTMEIPDFVHAVNTSVQLEDMGENEYEDSHRGGEKKESIFKGDNTDNEGKNGHGYSNLK